MASITLTVPDSIAVRVLNGYTSGLNYPTHIYQNAELVTNPKSRTDYMKEKLYSHIRDIVMQYEANEASRVAAENANNEINLS